MSESWIESLLNNFIHHRVSELAKDILEHSKEERITDTYFEEVINESINYAF